MSTPSEFPALPPIKATYFNSVGVAVSVVDVAITLAHNGIPILTLNTPHSVARSMVKALGESLADFEQATNRRIPTAEEVLALLNAHQNEARQLG